MVVNFSPLNARFAENTDATWVMNTQNRKKPTLTFSGNFYFSGDFIPAFLLYRIRPTYSMTMFLKFPNVEMDVNGESTLRFADSSRPVFCH